MGASTRCPVCDDDVADLDALAGHLVAAADASDARHVMWLNRNVTKHRLAPEALRGPLATALAGEIPSGQRVRR